MISDSVESNFLLNICMVENSPQCSHRYATPTNPYLVAVLQFSRDVVLVTSKYKLVMTINEEALDNNNKVFVQRAHRMYSILYITLDTIPCTNLEINTLR